MTETFYFAVYFLTEYLRHNFSGFGFLKICDRDELISQACFSQLNLTKDLVILCLDYVVVKYLNLLLECASIILTHICIYSSLALLGWMNPKHFPAFPSMYKDLKVFSSFSQGSLFILNILP